MCGICGLISYNRNYQIQRNRLLAMSAKLSHRGPDDQGIYINKGRPEVGLAHRRLSIIDLSPFGRQPLTNENGDIQIIFNGEIYNYKELRVELENKNHKFKSGTDSETVIHLYEEYGVNCLSYLRGMFAFAIWDDNKKTLFLARDRLGKKPLLYYFKNGIFCFASEFSAILASGLIDKRINEEAINYYLTLGYIPAPFTIYQDVFKLEPAHRIILKEESINIERYWKLDYLPKLEITLPEAQSEVLRLLEQSVKIRLYSDVPLGAFLSGGIDSSTVVALMSQLTGEKVKTFTIGFEEKDYSELNFARNIAKKFATQHYEFFVKPNALEVLPMLVEHYGEPYADSSCIPSYYVARETRREVTVALNGDGGDETFAGYERYLAMLIANKLNKFPESAKTAISALSRLLPDSVNPKNKFRRLKRFFEATQLAPAQRYLRWVGIFDAKSKEELYSDVFKKKNSHDSVLPWMSAYFENSEGLEFVDRLMRLDVNTYLVYDLLVKMDIASMANSLEVRSPFLDQELMEFVARLPAKYKLNGFVRKFILKKILKGMIPDENIFRRKMGFGVPVGLWFREGLKDFLRESLLSTQTLKRGYFNPHALRAMVEAHIQGKKDYAFQLWALLMLELWHRQFID